MKNTIAFLFAFLVTSSIFMQAQTIVSVNPDSGTQCERLTITVTGENTNFWQSTNFVVLKQDGHEIRALNNTVLHPDTIEGEFIFSYDDPTGVYDVIVDHWLWGGVADSGAFYLSPVVNPPFLVQTSPGIAHIGDTVTMEIIGENTHFDDDDISNNIYFKSEIQNGFSPFSTIVINSSRIQCQCYINVYQTPGQYGLQLHNELDGSLFLENTLTLLPDSNPSEIVSVVPDKGYQGAELSIVVTGRNTLFQQGTSTMFLSMFGYAPIQPDNQTVLNDTVIQGDFTFNYSQSMGLYDVVVIENYLSYITKEDGFQLLSGGNAPYLHSIDPQNVNQGTAVKFLIKAVNSHFEPLGNMPAITLINGYEELYCHYISVIDTVTLEANFVFSYANPLGLYDLVVTAPLDGTLRMENSVELHESSSTPAIVLVNPDSAMQGQTLSISVTGRDIVFMQGTSQLYLSQGNMTINPTTQSIVNDTVISGEFNFLTTLPQGYYNVNVDNGYAWPSLVLTDGFDLKLFDFVDEKDIVAFLTFYPNPVKETLYVKRNYNTSGEFMIRVFDVQGRLVLSETLPSGMSTKKLEVITLKKGTYLLHVSQGLSYQTEQFVIQ
ncbi:T9SS type A sorting domain-containing protein [Candidatus Peregrinibacteria bacterium]|nr:T9SS type A sorting domain-containing protein [Candidatus Peregrinibacteria bacterium]